MNKAQVEFIINYLSDYITDKEIDKLIIDILALQPKPKPLRCANCLELINDKQGFMTFTLCQNCYQLDRGLNEALKELFKKGNKKIDEEVKKNEN